MKLRDLTSEKLLASLAANHVASNRELEATPLAVNASKTYKLPLICKYSGIGVGSISVNTIAGHMPMIGQWKETMVLHPLFSLDHVALLHFSKNSWYRICSLSPEDAADERLVAAQEKLLCVSALVMLHKMANVNQEVSWVPAWTEVSKNWASLIALSYWKAYLDSPRFKFPATHISRWEPSIDLTSYLQECWAVKKAYEKRVHEKIEAAKLRAANTALLALRDDLAGKKPRSTRMLWRWFLSHLPPRYKKDVDGWMLDLFFAKDRNVHDFTMADIDLFEQIFLCEVPTGSSLSHAFLEVLRSKRKLLEDHFESFEIVIPQAIVDANKAGEIPAAEPQQKDFPTKVAFLVAHAKWRLSRVDVNKSLEASARQQSTVTVNPSYVPELKINVGGDIEEPESEDDERPFNPLPELDYLDQSGDKITGEIEDDNI